MNLVRQTTRYAIFDDVLDSKAFAAVWDYMELEEYFPVHQKRWEKTWRPTDGQPLAGATVRAETSGAPQRTEGSGDSAMRVYPTRLAIDLVLAKLFSMAEDLSGLVGIAGKDYAAITARPYLYPAGSALSWHSDPKPLYSGAFTYYAHPTWNATWGGELMVADESTTGNNLGAKQTPTLVMEGGRVVGVRQFPTPPALDHRRENEVLCASGFGEFIFAKPNRLVIMGPGTPHRIARIDPCAGENVRCSIAGCFVPAPS